MVLASNLLLSLPIGKQHAMKHAGRRQCCAVGMHAAVTPLVKIATLADAQMGSGQFCVWQDSQPSLMVVQGQKQQLR